MPLPLPDNTAYNTIMNTQASLPSQSLSGAHTGTRRTRLSKAPHGLEPLDKPRSSLKMRNLRRLRMLGHSHRDGNLYVATVKGGTRNTQREDLLIVKMMHKKNIRRLDEQGTQLKDIERRALGKLPFSHWISGLLGTCHDQQNLYLLLEGMPYGSLRDIVSFGPMDATRASFYFANLVCALAFLQEHKIVHLNLRPENILIGSDNYLFLTNFDQSAPALGFIQDEKWKRMDSAAQCHLAPELYLETSQVFNYSSVMDWWSCGSILLEMLTQSPMLASHGSFKAAESIAQGTFTWPSASAVGNNAGNVISGLLTVSPLARLGANGVVQVQEHPWLSHIDWGRLESHQYPAPALNGE